MMEDDDRWAATHVRTIFKDGVAWCAIPHNFRNLAVDCAGFGQTPMQAVENLRKAMN